MKKEGNEFDVKKYADDYNKGVNRKVYAYCVTSKSLFYFVVFPFIMVNAYFVSELNDFAHYNFSSLKKQGISTTDSKKVIDVYGCKYEDPKTDIQALSIWAKWVAPLHEEEIMRKMNLGLLERPLSFEIIKNFPIDNKSKYKYYLRGYSTLGDFAPAYVFIMLIFTFLAFLGNRLLNFYGNHFFNYDLMQAAHDGYFPCKRNALTNDYIFLNMIEKEEIKKLIQKTTDNNNLNIQIDCPAGKKEIDEIFEKDEGNEIIPLTRIQFIYNYNLSRFEKEYQRIWDDLPSNEHKLVLFDFAQDYFINYKNKYLLMDLMEIGVVDTHKITGRLKLMNPSFRFYILSQSKRNKNFSDEYKIKNNNGTFAKFRVSIVIIALSAMVLLVYLNKDSYDRLVAVGSGVGPLLVIIERIFNFNKTT